MVVPAQPLFRVELRSLVFGRVLGVQDFAVLVLEGIPLYLLLLPLQVQDQEFALRAGLPGHLVVVGLQFRTGLGQGVDYPEFLDGAHVPADEGKVLAVRSPVQAGKVAGGGVRFHVSAVIVFQIGNVLAAVRGEGSFYQGAVLGVLGGLFQVFLVHDPQVVVFHVHAHAAVRAHVGPGGVFVLMLLRVPGEFLGCDIVIETIFYELVRGASQAVQLGGFGGEIPLETFVFLEFQVQVQVLGVVGVTGDFRELTGQFGKVENLALVACGGIDNKIVDTLCRFPAVPELVTLREPVGADAGAVHHFAQRLGGKPCSLLVIGLLHFVRLLRLLRLQRQAQTQCQGNEEALHTL